MGLEMDDNWEMREKAIKDEGEGSASPLPERYIE